MSFAQLMDDTTVGVAERPVRTRADAMRFAIASTVMEGGTVSLETEHLLAAWAEGKLDDDELMAAALKAYGPRG